MTTAVAERHVLIKNGATLYNRDNHPVWILDEKDKQPTEFITKESSLDLPPEKKVVIKPITWGNSSACYNDFAVPGEMELFFSVAAGDIVPALPKVVTYKTKRNSITFLPGVMRQLVTKRESIKFSLKKLPSKKVFRPYFSVESKKLGAVPNETNFDVEATLRPGTYSSPYVKVKIAKKTQVTAQKVGRGYKVLLKEGCVVHVIYVDKSRLKVPELEIDEGGVIGGVIGGVGPSPALYKKKYKQVRASSQLYWPSGKHAGKINWRMTLWRPKEETLIQVGISPQKTKMQCFEVSITSDRDTILCTPSDRVVEKSW